MSDITCDYCGEEGMVFIRGAKCACESCFIKIMRNEIVNDPPFLDTPLGQTPIDQQRP